MSRFDILVKHISMIQADSIEECVESVRICNLLRNNSFKEVQP